MLEKHLYWKNPNKMTFRQGIDLLFLVVDICIVIFNSAVFLLFVLTILTGIKAGDGSSQHLNEVTHTPQVLVHVPKVCMNVVPIPGKNKNKQTNHSG